MIIETAEAYVINFIVYAIINTVAFAINPDNATTLAAYATDNMVYEYGFVLGDINPGFEYAKDAFSNSVGSHSHVFDDDINYVVDNIKSAGKFIYETTNTITPDLNDKEILWDDGEYIKVLYDNRL